MDDILQYSLFHNLRGFLLNLSFILVTRNNVFQRVKYVEQSSTFGINLVSVPQCTMSLIFLLSCILSLFSTACCTSSPSGARAAPPLPPPSLYRITGPNPV